MWLKKFNYQTYTCLFQQIDVNSAALVNNDDDISIDEASVSEEQDIDLVIPSIQPSVSAKNTDEKFKIKNGNVTIVAFGSTSSILGSTVHVTQQKMYVKISCISSQSNIITLTTCTQQHNYKIEIR